jgi:type III secretion system YscI/HrpB-like protein
MSADFLSGLAQKATETSLQQSIPSPATVTPDPSQADVSQFEQMLNVNEAQGAQGPTTDAGLSTSPTFTESTLAPNSGDAILGGLQKMTATYNANAAELQKTIEQTSADPSDMTAMFKIQYQMSTMTLQQDLTAKIADRASQGVQTFFKNQ